MLKSCVVKSRLVLLSLWLMGCQPAPPPPPPAGMVLVPAGPCILGADDGQAFFPRHQESLGNFYLDKCEVTQAEYKKFKPEFQVHPGDENKPVTHVTKAEVEAYLRSVGKRLPSAAEWEKAARGTDGRLYPWGNDWDYHKGNLTEKGREPGFCSVNRMKAVGSYPQGASPYGCLDMCGNAFEWVSDVRDGRPVLRGGAYGYRERDCRSSSYATEDEGFT